MNLKLKMVSLKIGFDKLNQIMMNLRYGTDQTVTGQAMYHYQNDIENNLPVIKKLTI